MEGRERLRSSEMQPGQDKIVQTPEGILIADVLHKLIRNLCAETARKNTLRILV